MEKFNIAYAIILGFLVYFIILWAVTKINQKRIIVKLREMSKKNMRRYRTHQPNFHVEEIIINNEKFFVSGRNKKTALRNAVYYLTLYQQNTLL